MVDIKSMEQENLAETAAHSPEASTTKSIAENKNMIKDLHTSHLIANLNKGGALQQLTEFLNLHAKGDTLNDFKGNTPTIPINDLRGDEAARYSRKERLLRCQLASLCRLIDLNGWTQSIYNHLSATCAPKEYLINPFGLLFHEVQASTLVKVDDQGNLLDSGSTVLGVNKAGWTLHSAVHSARSDIACVVHVHLPDVVAVSCIKSGLLSTSPEAAELLSIFGVNYHDYYGIVIDEAEVDSIHKDLGEKVKILFLRNKGVVIAASSIPEAWYLVRRVITACQTQMQLLQLGGGAALLAELSESTSAMSNSGVFSGSGHFSTRPFDGLADDRNGDEGKDPDQQNNDNCNGGEFKSSSCDIAWGVGEMDFEAQMRMLDSAGFRTGYQYRNPNLLRRPPTGMPWSDNTRSGTGADFFNTTDMSGGELSGIDDIAAAKSAGAVKMANITDSVRANKAKGNQRQKFLTKKDSDDYQSENIDVHAMPQQQSTPFATLPHVVINGTDESPQQMPSLDITSTKSTPTKKSKKKKSSKKHQNGIVDDGIDEPQTPPTFRNAASRSASLPAHAHKNMKHIPARTSNTLEVLDGVVSDNDERTKADKKPKGKFSSFRFPTFKKKKQPLSSQQSQPV